jgi:hypothetical protein
VATRHSPEWIAGYTSDEFRRVAETGKAYCDIQRAAARTCQTRRPVTRIEKVDDALADNRE